MFDCFTYADYDTCFLYVQMSTIAGKIQKLQLIELSHYTAAFFSTAHQCLMSANGSILG